MCKYIWNEKRISEYLEYLNAISGEKLCLNIVQNDKNKYPIALSLDCNALIYIPQFLNHESFSDNDIEAMLILCYASALFQKSFGHDNKEKAMDKKSYQNIVQRICRLIHTEPVIIEYLDKIVTPIRRNIFTSAEDKSYYSVGDVIQCDLCKYTITAIFEEHGDLKITFEGESPFDPREHSVHTELEDTVRNCFALVDRK